MSPSPNLIATCWTIAGNVVPGTDRHLSPFALDARIRAAASAGYRGIGLWHGDLQVWLQHSDYRVLRRLIEEGGLRHIELEYLADWFAAGDARAISDRMRKDLFVAAEALGARQIKIVPPFGRQNIPLARLIDEFGALCAEAEPHNVMIALEMIPYSDLPTLDAALAVISAANAPNGGLLLDIWHVLRSGASMDAILGLPQSSIMSAEINDARHAIVGDLATDSMHHRKLCGQGDFDIRGFVRNLARAGYNGPIGVEILSDDLRQLPLRDAAEASFATARAQFTS